MRSKDEIRLLLESLNGSSADDLEDEDIEFKAWESDPRTLHRMLRETAVCLANARGGTIILGVRDGFRTRQEAIEGVDAYDITAIRRSIYDGTEPRILVEIEELTEPEGTMVLIHIPRGMPPHTTSEGVAKIRIGKECKPLTGRAFAQLLIGGGQIDPTAEIFQNVTENDLDPGEIHALKTVIQSEARNPQLAGLDDHALLEALGLISPAGITLAGLLMVGKPAAIAARIPQHEVTFLTYLTTTRYEQRRDMRGCLLSILRELEQFIVANNRLQTVQAAGFEQMEIPDISWEVAREVILNAITHRDYFLNQSVQVFIHDDHIEVISPGGLPAGITPQNILRHPPIHRNELLSRTFQSIGYVNRVGLGVDRIFEGQLRLGKGVPEYSSDEVHVRVKLPFQTNKDTFLFLTEEERRTGQSFELDDLLILHRLSHNAPLDRWSAATLLQLSEEESAERLADLKRRGYLSVRGRGRGAAYMLRPDLAERLGDDSTDAAGPVDDPSAIQDRILQLLHRRGRLTNSEIREFTGLSRSRVYQLVKQLEDEGKVCFRGKGRGAHIIPS